MKLFQLRRLDDAGRLADDLGEIRAEIAELRKREDEIKRALVRAGAGCARGRRWMVMRKRVQRTTLDTKAMRETLAESVLRPFVRREPVTRWEVTPNKV